MARASLGIAIDDGHSADVAGLIRDADVAMYLAKRRGGGRYELFETGMQAAVAGRLELETELRGAIERDELVVHYQPTVTLAGGEIVGVEALVRWHHPERGTISPGVFIPIAEESGLIVTIGRRVLEQACYQARQWRARASSAQLTVNVKLSVVQVQHPAIVAQVADVLRATGLPAHALTLEITETALMDDVEAVVTTLRDLKALGVHLAIDDFGTGYSSLNYRQRLPIDILKIDKAFVDGVERGEEACAFARTICDLARTLGLRTVAEGIEQQVQGERLL